MSKLCKLKLHKKRACAYFISILQRLSFPICVLHSILAWCWFPLSVFFAAAFARTPTKITLTRKHNQKWSSSWTGTLHQATFQPKLRGTGCKAKWDLAYIKPGKTLSLHILISTGAAASMRSRTGDLSLAGSQIHACAKVTPRAAAR